MCHKPNDPRNMASVDTRDSYYTIPVALEHQKYLKFTWRDKLY